MDTQYLVYGGAGSGSVPVEAALTLLGLPYRVEESQPWLGGDDREVAGRVNPLRQVPSLVLPSGEVMTESAAILLWLADRFAPGRLAPLPDAPERSRFLRWTVFVPAQIYAMFLLKDDPSVWLHGAEAQDELRERAIERIKTCWRVMEAEAAPAPFLLGEGLTVLDLYVTVVSRWTPRRRWFVEACPRLAEVARRVDALPELQDLWAARFPFENGWEG